MTKSIASFSFDKAKAGRILKQYIEESTYSQRQIAPMVGMSEDMLSNVLRGMNKEISLERIFKICIVTGRPVCEFIREMLDGEDIDFRAEFEAICPPSSENLADASAPRGIAVRKVAVAVEETKEIIQEPPLFKSLGHDVLAFIRADRAEQAQRTSDIYHEHSNIMLAQYKDQIQQLIEQNKATIAYYKEREQMLIREHDQHLADIKAAHIEAVDHLQQERDREIGYLKAENVRQRKWIVRLGIMLGIETAAVVGVFIYDALNHSVGWFRGFLKHFSNAPFDALKS